ncbi:MAG: PIN domain-containing protein [Pirellulaceae bacterium]|nr:PIN domain-containing protein [Pirellulaceae bacterium]
MKVVCPPIVLDTNVLVAGACRHALSLAYRLLLTVLQKRVAMILTESIIGEYLDVLSRRHVRSLTGLTVKQSSELVLNLIALSFQTQLHFSWRPNTV